MPLAVALFSGGLDSLLAVRIMQRQGFRVEALHVRTLFPSHEGAADAARALLSPAQRMNPAAATWPANPALGARICDEPGSLAAPASIDVPLTVMPVADDYLQLLRRARFGYGKGRNPCVDCRITMCRIAKRMADELGAEVVVSGEVLGQRPMSQKRRDLEIIAYHSGLEGRLLRPLSAQLLPPTAAEIDGRVDRSRLYGIVGQSRRPLLKLAAQLGIEDPPPPSSGCALAQPAFAERLDDLLRHTADVTRWDIELLRFGRQLRSENGRRVILGRNAADNAALTSLAARADARACTLLVPENFSGPTALVVGDYDAAANAWASAEVVGRSRLTDPAAAKVQICVCSQPRAAGG